MARILIKGGCTSFGLAQHRAAHREVLLPSVVHRARASVCTHTMVHADESLVTWFAGPYLNRTVQIWPSDEVKSGWHLLSMGKCRVHSRRHEGASDLISWCIQNLKYVCVQVNMVHWNCDGFKIGLCGTPPAAHPRALCKLCLCTIPRCFCSQDALFPQLLLFPGMKICQIGLAADGAYPELKPKFQCGEFS